MDVIALRPVFKLMLAGVMDVPEVRPAECSLFAEAHAPSTCPVGRGCRGIRSFPILHG